MYARNTNTYEKVLIVTNDTIIYTLIFPPENGINITELLFTHILYNIAFTGTRKACVFQSTYFRSYRITIDYNSVPLHPYT